MKYVTDGDLDTIEDLILATIDKSKKAIYRSNMKELVWTKDLVDARSRWIITQMVKNGKSILDLKHYIQEHWNVAYHTAVTYVKIALDSLAEINDDNKNIARAIHRERLEDLYSRAIERNRIDSALKVLEQMAKINGYYNDLMVVNIPVMEFKFNDEDNLIHMKPTINGGEKTDDGGL